MIDALRERLGRVLGRDHLRPEAFPFGALLLAVGALLVGLLFVSTMADSPSNLDGQEIDYLGHREKVLFALPMFFLGLFLRPAWLRRYTPLVYLGCVALLALVPIVGIERNQAKRWIQLPRFDLQPSELAKIGVILMLAGVLHANPLRGVVDWLKPLVVVLVPMALVAAQPDLGTALTLVPVTLGLIYLAGGSGRTIVGMAAAGALTAIIAVQGGLIRGYQLERIETWVESFDADELIAARNGPGFHTYHARAFIGNGGLTGRGLGEGVANETGLLPERDCDSIIAVVGEEWGFLGTSAVLLGYALMVLGLFTSASRVRDRYARLVVGGVAIYFAAHLIINVSVNVGLLPMTGLTLPLLSTGGSSLLATFLGLGIALGMASHHERNLGSDAFRRY
ncbi:MAG: FtsW/RodA/SpoVE family cell cycle protein [Planctomycetota bacterium]